MSHYPRIVFLGIVLSIGMVPLSARAQLSLNEKLTPYLEEFKLPALAAAVVKDGKIIASGAVGTRRYGENIPVTINDRFHLGSDTKAMTSLLAAMFVEEGKLRWDTTVAEAFPDLADRMDEGLRAVTVTQLLSHTSGIPSDNATFSQLVDKAGQQPGNLDEQRLWLVGQWAGQKLETKPGTAFAYANINYVIVGAMLERISKKTWDELIFSRIFGPLELRTAGLGPQSSLGKVDAPLGHLVSGTVIRAMLAGPNGDNPIVLGPAGIAHMSVLDFAR